MKCGQQEYAPFTTVCQQNALSTDSASGDRDGCEKRWADDGARSRGSRNFNLIRMRGVFSVGREGGESGGLGMSGSGFVGSAMATVASCGRSAGDRVRALEAVKYDLAKATEVARNHRTPVATDLVNDLLPVIAAELDKQDAADAVPASVESGVDVSALAADMRRVAEAHTEFAKAAASDLADRLWSAAYAVAIIKGKGDPDTFARRIAFDVEVRPGALPHLLRLLEAQALEGWAVAK